METKTFEIIKINKTWITAKLNGSTCKIRVDDNTRDLELGAHELVVNDISIRNRYGTDLRFEVVAENVDSTDKVMLDTTHSGVNKILFKLCKMYAGKYEHGLWIFPKFVAEQVDELDEIFNSRKVVVEVGFPKGLIIIHGVVSIFGYSVAETTNLRDVNPRIKDNIAVMKGSFSTVRGCDDWDTRAERGTVIRLEVPELLVETWLQNEEYQKIDFGDNGYNKDDVEIKIIK